MSKQTKLPKAVWIVIGLVVITVAAVFTIVKNQSVKTEPPSETSLEKIIESRKTWNVAFTSWFGKNAPDFTVKDVEGNEQKLSNYQGRDVLVVFWATWCPACNLEIPHLIELRKKLEEDKLVILAISNESPELLRQYAATKKINYKVVSADISTLPAPFSNVSSIPATFFIDGQGTIKLAAEGLVSLEEAEAIMQAQS